MPTPVATISLILFAGMLLSIITKKLTVVAAVTGGMVGFLVYQGAGFTGVGMLALFFVLGSAATGWRRRQKESCGLAEKNKGRRTVGQVLANGGVAAGLGIFALLYPQATVLIPLMIAGSLASATADTLSSELGIIYGRRIYDLITFKKVAAGDHGVISAEGTLIGAAGAVLIALVYSLGFGFSLYSFSIVAGGAIGNLTDSLLGAIFERRGLMSNNLVNFLNTATGALVCLLAYLLLKP